MLRTNFLIFILHAYSSFSGGKICNPINTKTSALHTAQTFQVKLINQFWLLSSFWVLPNMKSNMKDVWLVVFTREYYSLQLCSTWEEKKSSSCCYMIFFFYCIWLLPFQVKQDKENCILVVCLTWLEDKLRNYFLQSKL